jgi:CBS domain containing-hemolysin-like protein
MRDRLSCPERRAWRWLPASAAALGAITAVPAHASIFSGDTLDAVANALAWIVLIIAPVIAIGVFWMVHILPEKVAEKRHHPQLSAIKTLCLLSLVFGGLLWPLAWLWAYTKPVLHKMAYGTDKDEHAHADAAIPAREDFTEDETLPREHAEERHPHREEV